MLKYEIFRWSEPNGHFRRVQVKVVRRLVCFEVLRAVLEAVDSDVSARAIGAPNSRARCVAFIFVEHG